MNTNFSRFNPLRYLEFDSNLNPAIIVFGLLALLGCGLAYFIHITPVLLSTAEIAEIAAQRSAASEIAGLLIPSQIHDWWYWFIQLNFLEFIPLYLPRFIPMVMTYGGLIAFYFLLRLWFRRYDAVWGVALLASNLAFLLSAATPMAAAGYILLVLCAALTGLTLLYRKEPYGLSVSVIAVGLGVYGGAVGLTLSVLTIIAIAYSLKIRRPHLSKVNVAFTTVALFLLLLPALLTRTGLTNYTHELQLSITNFFDVSQFVVIGLADNTLGLAATWPLLSVAELTLLVLALLLLKRKRSALRYGAVLGVLAVSLVLAAIYGVTSVFVTIFLPTVTILVLAAARYLRDKWYALFPHNKAARTVARIGMYSVLSSIIILNVYKSFIFYPNLQSAQESTIIQDQATASPESPASPVQ